MDVPAGDRARDSVRDHARAVVSAAMLRDTAAMAPDLVFEVEHGDCGDVECTRDDGPVSIAVTWLDPAVHGAAFRADIDDRGHVVCQQIVQRATERLTRLAGRRP